MNTTMTSRQLQTVLDLAEQKGLTPDRMTKILASGILADVFDERTNFSDRGGSLTHTISVNVSSSSLQPPDVGWKLLKDTQGPMGTCILELAPFLKDGENANLISREEMVRRAETIGCLGECHARALLENQHLIPHEWRAFYLGFLGTLWHGSNGHFYFPYLYWVSHGWELTWMWFGEDEWCCRGRFVRPHYGAE